MRVRARHPWLAWLWLGACVLAACGSDEAGAAADGGGQGGGQCIADDEPCGPADDLCRGDCRGRTCCGGLCAGEICASDNIDFEGSCPAACGGDPVGTWRVVGACGAAGCASPGSGAVAADGVLEVTVDGGSDVTIGYDTHCDGYINHGGGRSLGGTWSSADETVGGYPYCVDGDTLWVIYDGESGLPGITLQLARED